MTQSETNYTAPNDCMKMNDKTLASQKKISSRGPLQSNILASACGRPFSWNPQVRSRCPGLDSNRIILKSADMSVIFVTSVPCASWPAQMIPSLAA